MDITQNSRGSRAALKKFPGVFRDPGQNESYLSGSWLFLTLNSAELQQDSAVWLLPTKKKVQGFQSGEEDHPGTGHAANG